MSTSPSAVPAGPPDERPRRTVEVDRVAEGLHGMVRSLHTAKAAAARDHLARGGAEGTSLARAALHLLVPLREEGPLRASALAEAVHADPSTVSRQTGELVREGLVERLADPDDGRASLLAVTDAGRSVCDAVREQRLHAVARLVEGWPDEDLTTFADLLARFVAAGPPVPGTHHHPVPVQEDR